VYTNTNQRWFTLNDKSRSGGSLSGGARQLTRVRYISIIRSDVGDGKTRRTLGYFDVVLVRLGDLRSGHEPCRTRGRDAAELPLELPSLPHMHLSRTDTCCLN